MNDFFETLAVAFSAIRMNALRAVLTILIIGFGIMSLISMLTAVDGMQAALYKNFAQVGSNTITISPATQQAKFRRRGMRRRVAHPILYREAYNFSQRFKFPSKTSISFNATRSATAQYGNIKTSPKISVFGVDDNYLSVTGYGLELGRNFSSPEIRRGTLTALIGSKLKEDLFGPQDPLGKSILISGKSFIVIGSLKEKGSSFGGNQDNIIMIPLIAAQSSYPQAEDNYNVSVQIDKIEQMDFAINEATGLFRSIRKLDLTEENDFEIQKNDALEGMLYQNVGMIKGIAVIIGLITLLGAAVALTNIMLVSVTERTREIGVRKALGATSTKIRNQFLTEAIVICQIGGLSGIIAGIFIGNLVSSYFKGSFIFPWGWISFGVFLCVLVGVLAGLYPAAKAARLDPIESLRYE